MPSNEVFPVLQSCTALDGGDRIYDVKFYPYAASDHDQVFAAVTETATFVCRPKLGQDPPFEILRWFQDEKASLNCLTWAKHPVTQKPLLCVGGHRPKHIRVFDIESGVLIRTLAGHGKGINDLTVSPLSTSLLASGAEDDTIRLWNLEDEYAEQPCVALFGSEGHRTLAIRFHPNGKWLLSGGTDTAVCLWAVPSPEELARSSDCGEYPPPLIVFAPHFFSKEVHSNYVDCFDFYGDLIFSRAARNANIKDKANEILLWKIDGFNSDDPPPTEPLLCKPGSRTRTSFPHDTSKRGFQRVLTFSMPSTSRFYHRFALFHSHSMRPILAMGNEVSKFFFWDLQRLEEGVDPRDEPGGKKGRGKKAGVEANERPTFPSLRRLPSHSHNLTPDESSSETPPAPAERVFTLDDRFKPLAPHHTKIANTKLSEQRHFATSNMDWSPDGTWLVGVGDFGMMCIFHRDESVL